MTNLAKRYVPRARRIRTGLSLIEVIIAIAILVGSAAAISQLIDLAQRNAIRALDVTDAQTVCQNILHEVMTGMRPLETTRMRVDREDYRPRFVIVYDKNYNIVSTLRQIDLLRTLEPEYGSVAEADSQDIASDVEEHDSWSEALTDMCRKASERRVKDIAGTPDEAEFIDEDAPLAEAIHVLLTQKLHSLIVTGEKGFRGIVRLTDVFSLACKEIQKLSP